MKALRISTSMLVLAAATTATAAGAQELTKVSYGTNWVAQAEHGGFYQAVADGTYAECGLDVTIVPGGPQVNNRAQMLAGRIDFYMGGLLGVLSASEQGVPTVMVAAMFQKDPQIIMAHPGKASSFADLKNLKLFIGDEGFATYYQWMIKELGFTAEQRAVYTFNSAPFISDDNSGQQGYLTSEPMAIEKEAGWVPVSFLLADQGYKSYSTTIETMADTIANRPEVVTCFVEGSAKGWYNYLYGDNAAANAMIKADNPDMSDEQIAFSLEKMKEAGIVDSGDALTLGIGAMTDAHIEAFYQSMVQAEVLPADLDYKAAYTLDFVNKGVGLDLKP